MIDNYYLNHLRAAIQRHKPQLRPARLRLPLQTQGHHFCHVKTEIPPSPFSKEPSPCSVFPEGLSSPTGASERAREEQI